MSKSLSKIQKAALLALANRAVHTCNVADSAELEDRPDAKDKRAWAQDDCEAFFEPVNALLTEKQDADLTQRCYKANTQEQIQHTLNVLGVTKVRK